jgi:pantoate--beta-alanine ligase
LKDSAARIAAGDPIPPTLEAATRAIAAEGFQLDYFEARHAQTLAPVRSAADGPLRLLVAARIGKTRLIDNIAVR